LTNTFVPEAATLALTMTVSNELDLSLLLADTEAEILRVVGERDPSTAGVYEMIRYHLGLDGTNGPRGKRMRPLLGLLAYASIAGDHRAALPGAAAVELGHNFSLVHDDIEDGDVERRHRATLWALHGVPQAINTGDLIFSLSRVALHRLTDLGFSDAKVLRLMRLYDETCVLLCEGQYIDIATSAADDPMTVELYFDMIGRKTAALISASIEAGALLATDDEAVIAGYRRFGWALGLAFQLNDDLLGIWGQEQKTGKEPTDVARHKKTLPVLYAFQHGEAADRRRLGELYASPEPTTADVAEIVAILERSGGQDFTRDEARRYRDAALAELDGLGVVEPAARERLTGIILSVISA
jgi:geranylgeranyl diphosphate synthase type I